MATLQKIRSHGPLLVIVIGLALFAFIAGDMWKVIQPHSHKQDVGVINGKTLNVQEFQQMVDEYTEVVKMAQGVNALNDQQLTQIKDQVWQTYVNNQLISTEAKKLGLTVTDKEIQNIIDEGTNPLLTQTPFRNPQTGAFDKDELKNFLVQYANLGKNNNIPAQYAEYYEKLGTYWKFIERTLRESTLAEKYQNLINKSILSNPIDAQNSFDARTIQTDVLLAAVPFSSIPDSTINITKEEIQKLYNQKKETFKQTVETRNFQYIDVTVVPSDSDRAQVKKEVTEYAEQLASPTADLATFIRSTGSTINYSNIAINKTVLPTDVSSHLDSVAIGEVFGPYYNQADDSYNAFRVIAKVSSPDSIQFRQLQVALETSDKTKALADSIFGALKGGADFETIAKTYGQNTESNWIYTPTFEGSAINEDNANFLNSLINASMNEWNMLKVGQGFIISQVLDKKSYKDKYNIAVVKRPIEFSKDTYNKAYNDFSQFVAQNPKKEDVLKNAENSGYNILERSDFNSAEHYVGGVSNTREVIKWIFNNKENEVSPLFECGNNNHLMIVILNRINNAGYRNINAVADVLRAEIVRNKKAEQIMGQMKGVDFAAAKAIPNALSDTVKHITFAAPVYVAVTRASEPVLSAYASKTEINKSTTPIKGNAGVYVMQVINREKGTETFNDNNEEALVKSNLNRYANMFISDLYEKAKVKDERYLFF
ncbi:MAG: peptidylprolyl isomerase [Phocaeicola sp.]|uniref:peptidylprolyl isomerase n=1 Tax=Phocaeicola sp. TaxID=2773926 RepID=UPI003FA179B5